MQLTSTDPAYLRLMVLFFLDRLGIPVTLEQLTRCFLQQDWMLYFDLQQTVVEMTHASPPLLIEELHQPGRMLMLTDDGRQVLSLFETRLLPSLRDAFVEFAEKNRPLLLEENQVSASYARLASGEYIVSCRILEGDIVLLDLSLSVVSLAQAKLACDQWKTKASEIYRHMTGCLLIEK